MFMVLIATWVNLGLNDPLTFQHHTRYDLGVHFDAIAFLAVENVRFGYIHIPSLVVYCCQLFARFIDSLSTSPGFISPTLRPVPSRLTCFSTREGKFATPLFPIDIFLEEVCCWDVRARVSRLTNLHSSDGLGGFDTKVFSNFRQNRFSSCPQIPSRSITMKHAGAVVQIFSEDRDKHVGKLIYSYAAPKEN